MIKLTNRLSAVAELVRENASLADVGCDHGYLPVYLILNGRIKSAVAGDINEGPLNSCIQLVAEYSLEDKIKCVLSNGLQSIDEKDCSDIAICGMGGELIAQIINECVWAKNSEKHFILNPMTHPEILRKYLCDNGFEIHNDIIVKEGRHYYSVFDAYYTGNIKSYPKSYYYLGNIKNFEYKEYFNHLLNYLENKSKGGEDFSDVISAIKEKL
ncbi:MAG: class I SAM-dependent methyltransferase [Eubacterium sp.]|nr:class I SAM-dependent methyltransferase [Eubacterium sp.]